MVGQDRLVELLDRYGDETVTQAIGELRERAAEQMRAHISALPDGTYYSKACVDSDGVVDALRDLRRTAGDGPRIFRIEEGAFWALDDQRLEGAGAHRYVGENVAHVPKHLSKEQDIPLKAGDRVRVETPGGGGYGDPRERDPGLVQRDVAMGYYTSEEAERLFGVNV
jgi:N-methylhydantoinase B/oxoprolinase/acetone carboxylase alpha subunit